MIFSPSLWMPSLCFISQPFIWLGWSYVRSDIESNHCSLTPTTSHHRVTFNNQLSLMASVIDLSWNPLNTFGWRMVLFRDIIVYVLVATINIQQATYSLHPKCVFAIVLAVCWVDRQNGPVKFMIIFFHHPVTRVWIMRLDLVDC